MGYCYRRGDYMTKQLFEGQTNHPLSEAEIETFFFKVELRSFASFRARVFSGRETRQRVIDFFKKGLEKMMKTPTGREQVREIIASKDEYRVWGVNKPNDPHTHAYIEPGSLDVYVNLASVVEGNPAKVGQFILHELLHQRQKVTGKESKVLADCETYALTFQLDTEAKNLSHPQYQKSFEYNKRKWKRIAQSGRYPNGFNGLRFKPIQGLSQAELIEAQEQYAHQMASLETRAEATKDFLKPAFEWGKNSSLKYPNYALASRRELYSGQDYCFYSNNERPIVSKQLAQDIVSRNPFLKESDFYSLWQEKSNEKPISESMVDKLDKIIEVYNNIGGIMNVSDLKIWKSVIDKEQDPMFKKLSLAALKKLEKKGDISVAEENILKHTFLCNLNGNDMKPQIKKELMYAVIEELQLDTPLKNELRTKIIERTARVIGVKELPIVQNGMKGNPLNTLRTNAVAYHDSPEITPTRSSREGMS